MAVTKFIAPSRAHTGPSHPVKGVIHVRTRLAADFTILHNALAQRPGSAVTVGVGTYIQSLPDGAPVTVEALCTHFDEGRTAIARALRDLERAGYLVRRKERWTGGLIRTRTFFRTVPELSLPDADSDAGGTSPDTAEEEPPTARAAHAEAARVEEFARQLDEDDRRVDEDARQPDEDDRRPDEDAQRLDEDARIDEDAHDRETSQDHGDSQGGAESREEGVRDTGAAGPPPPRASSTQPAHAVVGEPAPLDLTGVDPQAVVILASLRIVDPRLVLSQREVGVLAPAVTEWLAQGIDAARITEQLTAALPTPLRARPARLLAYRLRERPVPLPSAPSIGVADTGVDTPSATMALHPWQTCDGGCERPFRSAEPGSCRDCAHPGDPAPAPPAEAATSSLASMRTALRDSRTARAAAPAKRPRIRGGRAPWQLPPAAAALPS